VEPRPEDAPGGDPLAPGSSDIADLGVNELGLLGYPRALPSTCQLEAGGWRCRVDEFMGCGRGPTAQGDIGHGRPRCSATSPG
jgi:hypothetical protein